MGMTYDNGRGDDPREGTRRWVKPAVAVVALVGLAALVWHFANDKAGVKRSEAPQVTTVIPLPPPPQPPREQKPPPEKQPDVQTPTQKPTVAPKPADAPKPSDNQPKSMTENAPAQAGTDNFGIGAGDGSGMAGSGGGGAFGNATYSQYLSYTLQQAVEHDKRVQDAGGGSRFSVGLNLWLDTSGHITKVALGQSTGDPKLDAAVIDAIQTMGRLDEAPPPAWQYPVRLNLQGRQPG
ncbi:energy transducer TonB [Pararobbsia silviterrae]|uniref:Energy transducer TonB n=1 Tax=Pararobbsia silviterrae TaxID=1792498 RepID=A0A494YCC2_9BURK|nr:energy transducer TonB [Pararobbsia silviterrae]RKP57930.1 energy transducer TonB [Pararobbsia silviterrae]